MIPELFRIGSISISPFGLTMVLAFVASYFQLRQGMNRLGVGNEEDASSIVVAGGIGGILGAKIYYAFLYADWRLLFSRSGLVWYGGFLLATAAVIWTIRRRKLPVMPTVDAAAVALPLGYGIGRIGCFLVGDDYGVPTEVPWGVAFKYGLPPTTAANLRHSFGVDIPPEVAGSELLTVHPTQIYETLIALAIWLVGRRLLGRSSLGVTSLCIFALLACERFGVEFLRAKDDRYLGHFTLAQLISVGVLIVVAWLWFRRSRAVTAGGSAKPP